MYIQQFSSKNKFYKKYPILITLGFFIITSYVAFVHHNYWFVDQDGLVFLHTGEEILKGNGKNVKLYDVPIGGPVLFAIVNSIFNDGFAVMKAFSVLGGTGTVFLSYFVLNNIFNSRIALLGQLFVAFNPWIGFYSIMAENELLPLLLTTGSLYFITKKHLSLKDIVMMSLLLGGSFMLRFQAIFVLLTSLIYLLIRNHNVSKNIFHVVLLFGLFFLTISPMLTYNFLTHDDPLDADSSYYMRAYSKYKTQEWVNNLKEFSIQGDGTLAVILVDFHLFVKNYFYNLFYNIPAKLFNFFEKVNTSPIVVLPIIGIIPILGGYIQLSKINLKKNNLILLISTFIITLFSILLFGDTSIHFFALIIIPLLALGIKSIKKIEKTVWPLLILPIVFSIVISIVQIQYGEQYFMIWISIAMFSSIFFIETIPRIFLKIKNSICKKEISKIPLSVTIFVMVAVSLILLTNFGYAYVNLRATSSGEPFISIGNEFSKLFENKPLEQRGMEVAEILNILSQQPDFENSYLMAPQYYYYDYKLKNKVIQGHLNEGPENDTIENYIARKNWSKGEIYDSDTSSFPIDRLGLNNPVPNYLIYDPTGTQGQNQHEYLKVLADPNNPMVPTNFKPLYISNKTGVILYKINYQN